MATVPLTPEEVGWVEEADAADEGKGISLADVDLEDMKEVYDALKVTGLAKTRLRTLIRKLKTQQQQPNGKLRCCCCIKINGASNAETLFILL
jgi:hypothetical protein